MSAPTNMQDLTVTDLKDLVDDYADQCGIVEVPGYRQLYYPHPDHPDCMTSAPARGQSHAGAQYQLAEHIAQAVYDHLLRGAGKERGAVDLSKHNHSGGKKGAIEILRRTLNL